MTPWIEGMWRSNTLTVGELIEQLKSLDPNLPLAISSEGQVGPFKLEAVELKPLPKNRCPGFDTAVMIDGDIFS